MNARTRFITALLGAALLVGCIPEKRIVWSPDGSRAAVATPNGLFFIDPDGKVLDPRLPGTPVQCDWFPDNRRLAVVHGTKAQGWAGVKPLFEEEQTRHIAQLAAALRTRVLAYEGNWDDFDVDPEGRVPPATEMAVLLYMRDNLADGLSEKLGDKWGDVMDIQPDIWHLQVFTLGSDGLKPGKLLLRSLGSITQPKVSPNGKVVAMLRPVADGKSDASALCVVAVEGGEPRSVADFVAIDYDWSPDSRWLAYVYSTSPAPGGGDSVQLGSLATIRVAAEDGTLMKEWGERNDRVGLLFNHVIGLRWLSDGRLLFSAVEAKLPATTHDMPQRWSLFLLDPRMPASLLRVLGRDFTESTDVSLPLFDVSPDEKRVLLLGEKNCPVLYDFAKGETRLLHVPTGQERDVNCLPVWRNNEAVSFVRPGPTQGAASEVVLWQDGDVKTLSENWPDEMKQDWLVGK